MQERSCILVTKKKPPKQHLDYAQSPPESQADEISLGGLAASCGNLLDP